MSQISKMKIFRFRFTRKLLKLYYCACILSWARARAAIKAPYQLFQLPPKANKTPSAQWERSERAAHT